VISLPDPKKGERLILVTDRRGAEPGPLITHAKSIGAPEIAVPRKIIMVEEIPVLGTGKTDYPADPGCSSSTDTNETTSVYQCDDGLDNDGDAKVDGTIVYDTDISPDGRTLSASFGLINGKQSVRLMSIEKLLKGDATPEAEFELGGTVVNSFTFSKDGKYLYGTSYFSGVSNIFRYEIATKEIEAVTNE